MNLNAYVNHEFARGFLLKEEDLTKLLDSIKTRASEVNADNNIRVKVYRSDSLVYESLNLDLLRNEENAIRNKISRVQVLLVHDDLKVELDFDEEYNTSIKIESTDRDRAYLLFSELKEYLNTEVLVFRKYLNPHDRALWVIFPMMTIFFIGIAAFVFFSYPYQNSHESIKSIIASDDINLKLNHLISEQSARNGDRNLLIWLPILMIISFVSEPCFRWTQKHWYPRNVFYFGKEKNRYDQFVVQRSKWTWGGVVAFIVSVLAGFAVWAATKN